MNKKVAVIIIMFFALIFTGCEEVPEKGIYKEGTYVGFSEYELGNIKFTTFATVYVNELGMIKSVSFDSTYIEGSSAITRKFLKNTLAIDENGEVSDLNWNEQAALLEKAIIKEQDLNFIKWSNDDKSLTDSVKGLKMPIKDLYESVDNALSQAK